ncbi:MAG TPA: hypothetical protein VIL71_10995 [Spirillospora sp.]
MRTYVIAALTGLACLALAGTASAGENDGVVWELNYTTTKAKTLTGFSASIDSTGTADATGKPRAARRVTITFAAGTRFNTRVRPTCSAAVLRSDGPDGCPSRSRIGTGSAEAVTGLTGIDPISLDIRAFNARNGILFHVTGAAGGLPLTLVLEGKLRGRKLTVDVPRQPLPTPFGEGILTKFNVRVGRISSGRGRKKRNFATTPSTCRNGRWTTEALFQYDDGRIRVRDTDTCRRTRSRR